MFSGMYVCTPCVCSDPGGQKKALDSHLELGWQAVVSQSGGCWEPNPGSLWEQPVLLNHWTNSSFLFVLETGSLSVAPYDLELNYVERRLLLPNAVQFLIFLFLWCIKLVCMCVSVCVSSFYSIVTKIVIKIYKWFIIVYIIYIHYSYDNRLKYLYN